MPGFVCKTSKKLVPKAKVSPLSIGCTNVRSIEIIYYLKRPFELEKRPTIIREENSSTTYNLFSYQYYLG